MSGVYPYDPNINQVLRHRYNLTMRLLECHIPAPARLLDIGEANPLSEHMGKCGYEIVNTEGDLDDHPEIASTPADAVTAFEILEHLVAPLPLLQSIRAPLLIATVPLRLWIARAYRHPTDPRGRHYHEFEDWQFDWLLDKAGWVIVHREKWTSPTGWVGFRPLLRRITPRYYAVVARRKSPE